MRYLGIHVVTTWSFLMTLQSWTCQASSPTTWSLRQTLARPSSRRRWQTPTYSSSPKWKKDYWDKFINFFLPSPHCSVTRLGEILKVFRQFLKALLTICQNFDPTLANILCYWTNLHCQKWANIKKTIQPSSGHTDTWPNFDARFEVLNEFVFIPHEKLST